MIEAQVPNVLPVLPELFLVLVGMALLMQGVFYRDAEGAGAIRLSRFSGWLGVVALLLTTLLVVMIAGPKIIIFDGMFVSDPYSAFFKVLILLATAVTLIMSQDYLESHSMARFEYTVLVLLATVGMMMMVSANDLLALYVGLEMQSLALYVVASFQKEDSRSTEAGLKYFVLGALASGILLYGMSLVYGFAGSTDFNDLAQLFAHSAVTGHTPDIGVIVGLIFVIAGLAFKVSAVPFHMWTPDVYEGAPTPVTAFFAAAPKLAAIGLLMRVMMVPFFDLHAQWLQVMWVVAFGSMVIGAFAAINQTNIKRLMAYSSIGNIGYALVGLVAGTAAGVQGVMIYMAIYVVMTIGAFACILGMRRDGRMVEQISDLAGLSKTHPLMAAAMAIFMFSLAGIPPLAGFFGKLYVFLAAIKAGLIGLAVLGVLASVVGAFYYIRIIKIMYFDDATEPLDRGVSREVGVVLAVTAGLILAFFLFPSGLLDAAGYAADSLMGG